MTRVFSLAALVVVASCVKRETVPPPNESSSVVATDSAPVITLERTACFGSCPVYSIAVTKSGEIRYQGKAHVRRTGLASGKIPSERVAALLSELEQAGYFTFDDQYTPSAPACGRAATDAPTVSTSATRSGRTKRITHYYGCSRVPGALTILEQKIDEALNSEQWTGR